MAYDVEVSKQKGLEGGVEGAVVGALSGIVIGILKIHVNNVPPELDSGISIGIGVLVGAAFLGVKRLVANWHKHHKDK
jgi:hypothetical protein